MTEPPLYEYIYCGRSVGDQPCPNELDHPTKPARVYCVRYQSTLTNGSSLRSLRCAKCREEHP